MGEILPDLLQLLKVTLKKCEDVFLDHRDLWHIFSDARLHIWQDHLPEASSIGQRIEGTIRYLRTKENVRGENGLVLLLYVLADRYPADDERHDLLLTLINQVQLAISQPVSPLSQQKKSNVTLAEANPSMTPMLYTSTLEQMSQCARAIALIEVTRYREGKREYLETGTGWLLAPGLVLTCWHVVAALASAEEPLPAATDLQSQIEHMLFFFNHREIGKGGIQYKAIKLEYPLNESDHPDFAVLRLEDRRDQPYRQFGYLPVELHPPFTEQTQFTIIQHPFGQHQQIADGHFVSFSNTAGRILYTTPTEAGTSGAPVLNRYNWRVVALHNGENREAQFREGTRIEYILSELQDKKPDLYNEIVEAQDTFNNSLLSVHLTNPLNPYSRSPVTTLYTPFSSTISSEQEVAYSFSDRDATIDSKRSMQKPKYSHLSVYNRMPVAAPVSQQTLPRQYTFVKSFIDCKSSILSLAFSPNGQYLVSGDNDGTIKLWDMSTTTLSYTLKSYTNATPSLVFSSDGRYLASGGDDGTIKLWDFSRRRIERTLQGHTEWISCLLFSSDGHYLVSGSDDGSMKVWEVSSATTIHSLKEQAEVFSIALNPTNQLVASSSAGQPVKLWNISTGRTQSLKEPVVGVCSLVFSPNGRYLVAGNDDGSITLRDATTWKTIHTLAKHVKRIRCMAFHPDGQLLASGGDDQTIQLWDVRTGTDIQVLTNHADRIGCIVFSPNGQFMVSGGRDATIILWKCV